MIQHMRLRQEFTIDCYDQEYVDGNVARYHVGIAARGILTRPDGIWESWRPLIDGYCVSDGQRAWLDLDRPVKHPAGMDLLDAQHALVAAFDYLGRGREFDGDMTSMPIKISFWLAEHLNPAVAHQVELALRGAVLANNAVGTN